MFSKKSETKVPINNLIASRWSGRAYDPEKILSREQIISLIEAARWAPSCFGDQPWRYIVFDKATNKTAWERAIDCLAEGNQTWAKDAPLLLLACADSLMAKNGSPNRWGQYDTGAASENLCLQATALGLMVHQMGGFSIDQAREYFAIPDQYTPMAMMSVGYQLAEEKIPDEIKEREYGDRMRNPIENNFFDGTWDKLIDTSI